MDFISGTRRVLRRIGQAGALLLLLGAAYWLGGAAWRNRPIGALDMEGPVAEWQRYGGDEGGTRFSPLTQIDPLNVRRLDLAWSYRTGDVSDGSDYPSGSSFETTPIVAGGRMFLSTPFGRVIALDPETGAELWAFDPGLDLTVRYSEKLVTRGVAWWADPMAVSSCRERVFHAVLDARVVALDAETGRPCSEFGDQGTVDLTAFMTDGFTVGEYSLTSPPVVVDDVVVIGSAIGDNRAARLESGVVRGLNARTGALLWSWNPLASASVAPASGGATERPETRFETGAGNAWAPLAADSERGLVFVPTGSASPDAFGGLRPGDNDHANSVVALRARTGELVWAFQVVHHDLWDYDVPAQPTLTRLHVEGVDRDVLIQPTKMGHVFVLDRDTGEPVFPVEERAVPQSTVEGERTAATQPFPTRPSPLLDEMLTADDAWGITPAERRACRDRLEGLRSEGIFTPPSLEGTLVYPSFAGGTNWGGISVDPTRGVMVANLTRLPAYLRVVPREEYDLGGRRLPGTQRSAQRGTPFGLERTAAVLSPLGIPCIAPPWGLLVAVHLESGSEMWRRPLGTTRDLAPLPFGIEWGTPNLGGSLVTASGLVFIGAAADNYLRAFHRDTGEEVWRARLPAGAQATPMTYRISPDSRQFVVVAAGGHSGMETTLGDYILAFALPE